jgi:hypothetical protein
MKKDKVDTEKEEIIEANLPHTGYLVQSGYTTVINYRVRCGSKREKLLNQLSEAYGLELKCRLIDRVLEDSYLIILERKRREADLAKREADLAEEKRI